MGSILQSKAQSLPVTQPGPSNPQPPPGLTPSPFSGIRKRLSSVSLRIQPIPSTPSSSSSSAFRFPRSRSLSSVSDQAKGWWDRGWAWIQSRKLGFDDDDDDLEEDRRRGIEGTMRSSSSWRRVFHKVRAEVRRLFWSRSEGRLPVRNHNFRYDSSNYNKNFDDGVNGR